MRRIILGSAAALVTTLASAPAGASGFLAARFGGEHGHPTTDNPTAMYYNPAGLALQPTHGAKRRAGWNFRLYLDGTFAYRTASYDRPAAAISHPGTPGPDGGFTPDDAIAANSGKADLGGDFVASPFVGVTTDFGIENFGAGLSAYVPFGGAAAWDKNDAFAGNAAYPGAVDGVQRWWTMDGRIQSLYVTAAAAYRIPELRLSLGLGVNAIQSSVHTVRARNLDGSDDLVVAGGTLKEGRSIIDVSGWNLGLSGGVIWEPVERVWIGLSYQSQPGLGEMHLDGTLGTVLADGQPGVTDVELQQSLPDIWRLGGRWQPDDRWELRLFGEYVRWSRFERMCIVNAANPECDLRDNGSEIVGDGSVIQNLPRNWDDAFGIRAGVSHWFTPGVEVYVGAGYDSNAVPDETIDPALMDMNKFTAAIGGNFALTDRWNLAATFTQVFYAERDVKVENVRSFEAPSAQPNAAGVYDQSISVLNVYTQYAF